jgi:hypothetical protein
MKKTLLTNLRTPLIPLGVGLLASIFLTTVYFGIVSWAESVSHAVDFFWQDRWIVLPIIIGFGVQAALYTILKWRLYMPVSVSNSIGSKQIPATGASMGVSGTTSTVAMVACCVHHVTDVLPILGLSACSGQNSEIDLTKEPSIQVQATQVQPTVIASQDIEPTFHGMKSDAQGFVTVDITPEKLVNSEEALTFVVALNTHSIDLSMDLAELTVLTTDTGKSVLATLWDAPRGGHHVEGKLSFPSSFDETSVLMGAKNITLTIKDLDVPLRTFTWQLIND